MNPVGTLFAPGRIVQIVRPPRDRRVEINLTFARAKRWRVIRTRRNVGRDKRKQDKVREEKKK